MQTTSKYTVTSARNGNKQISKHIFLRLVLSFGVGSLDFLILKSIKLF